MKLTDEVTVYRVDSVGSAASGALVGTVRANVSYRTADLLVETQGSYQVETMRVIIDPLDFDGALVRLEWKGERLNVDGPPLVRRKNGRDHHWTFPVKLST